MDFLRLRYVTVGGLHFHITSLARRLTFIWYYFPHHHIIQTCRTHRKTVPASLHSQSPPTRYIKLRKRWCTLLKPKTFSSYTFSSSISYITCFSQSWHFNLYRQPRPWSTELVANSHIQEYHNTSCRTFIAIAIIHIKNKVEPLSFRSSVLAISCPCLVKNIITRTLLYPPFTLLLLSYYFLLWEPQHSCGVGSEGGTMVHRKIMSKG